MPNFTTQEEKNIKRVWKTGYLIRNIEDKNSIQKIRDIYINSALKNLKKKFNYNKEDFLNNFHKIIKPEDLNSLRLKIIIMQIIILSWNYITKFKEGGGQSNWQRVAMQLRVNLSIQLPNDNSSLLPLHSDVWSGTHLSRQLFGCLWLIVINPNYVYFTTKEIWKS